MSRRKEKERKEKQWSANHYTENLRFDCIVHINEKNYIEEKFYIKNIFWRKSKDRQLNCQMKEQSTKGKTMICKSLHRKLKILLYCSHQWKELHRREILHKKTYFDVNRRTGN